MTLQEYLEKFKNVVSVVEYMRGSFGFEPDTIQRHLGQSLDQASGNQVKTAAKKAK